MSRIQILYGSLGRKRAKLFIGLSLGFLCVSIISLCVAANQYKQSALDLKSELERVQLEKGRKSDIVATDAHPNSLRRGVFKSKDIKEHVKINKKDLLNTRFSLAFDSVKVPYVNVYFAGNILLRQEDVQRIKSLSPRLPFPAKIVNGRILVNTTIRDVDNKPIIDIVDNRVFLYPDAGVIQCLYSNNSFFVFDRYGYAPFVISYTEKNPFDDHRPENVLSFHGYLVDGETRTIYAFNSFKYSQIPLQSSADSINKLMRFYRLTYADYIKSTEILDSILHSGGRKPA